MAKKDYYDILGVKKTDSHESIKKSYKKLALKYHPDKASEDKKKEYEDIFKEINEAYSTLSDPEKRKIYDSGGHTYSNQGSSFSGGDFSDVLRDLFGSRFSDDEDEYTGQPLRYEVTLEFMEAVFGCEKEISLKKDVFCDVCGGDGSQDKEFKDCSRCKGHGRLKVTRETPFGTMSQVIACDECFGVAKIPVHICSKCKGEGILSIKEKVKVNIPQGIDHGQTLRVAGGGNAIKNGVAGDLFLVIRVKPHKLFTREGFDVSMELPLRFSQAALGAEVRVPTLSSEDITIKVPKGTQSGSVLRLQGKGIPFLKDPYRRGDQFVTLTVKTPKKLSDDHIKLFEELAKLDE